MNMDEYGFDKDIGKALHFKIKSSAIQLETD